MKILGSHHHPALPQRLTVGPLPQPVEDFLRGLTTNARRRELAASQILADAGSASAEDAPDVAVEAPFTGATIGHVYAGDTTDVDTAFEWARTAQKSWAAVPIAERRAIFRRFHDKVISHAALLADIVQIETGKNRPSATDEVMDLAANTRYYANKVEKFLAPKSRAGAFPLLTKSKEYRRPVGIVGQITPWNYPLTLGMSDAVPAMLAGNAIVAKPDSGTPFTMLLVLALLYDAGLPRDVFQVVTGTGRKVGSPIAERCDFLMFTGSTATGKVLGEIAGRRLIGYSAELGGKNPLIIAEDAAMNLTVPGAVDACFANSGQLCVSIERIYCHRSRYEEFVGAFGERVRGLRMEAGLTWSTEMGSLASQAQLDTVSSYVDDAVEKGAKVIAGGRARPDLGPYFYEPTVLVDVPEDAKLRREEVFGPVVYIDPVDSIVEAIGLANDTPYGLNSAVFGEREKAWRIAELIEAGSTGVNDGFMAAWSAMGNVSGGMKESGMLHRHGEEGMLKYTESHNITEQRLVPLRGPSALPRRAYYRIMLGALQAGKTLRFLP